MKRTLSCMSHILAIAVFIVITVDCQEGLSQHARDYVGDYISYYYDKAAHRNLPWAELKSDRQERMDMPKGVSTLNINQNLNDLLKLGKLLPQPFPGFPKPFPEIPRPFPGFPKPFPGIIVPDRNQFLNPQLQNVLATLTNQIGKRHQEGLSQHATEYVGDYISYYYDKAADIHHPWAELKSDRQERMATNQNLNDLLKLGKLLPQPFPGFPKTLPEIPRLFPDIPRPFPGFPEPFPGIIVPNNNRFLNPQLENVLATLTNQIGKRHQEGLSQHATEYVEDYISYYYDKAAHRNLPWAELKSDRQERMDMSKGHSALNTNQNKFNETLVSGEILTQTLQGLLKVLQSMEPLPGLPRPSRSTRIPNRPTLTPPTIQLLPGSLRPSRSTRIPNRPILTPPTIQLLHGSPAPLLSTQGPTPPLTNPIGKRHHDGLSGHASGTVGEYLSYPFYKAANSVQLSAAIKSDHHERTERTPIADALKDILAAGKMSPLILNMSAIMNELAKPALYIGHRLPEIPPIVINGFPQPKKYPTDLLDLVHNINNPNPSIGKRHQGQLSRTSSDDADRDAERKDVSKRLPTKLDEITMPVDSFREMVIALKEVVEDSDDADTGSIALPAETDDWLEEVRESRKNISKDLTQFYQDWSTFLPLFQEDRFQVRTLPDQALEQKTALRIMGLSDGFLDVFWPFRYDINVQNQKLALIALDRNAKTDISVKTSFFKQLQRVQPISLPAKEQEIVFSFEDDDLSEWLSMTGLLENSPSFMSTRQHVFSTGEQKRITSITLEALARINSTHPDLYRSMAQLVSCIAFYRSETSRHVNGNSRAALGVIWLDPTNIEDWSVPFMAEQIVHEFTHISLSYAEFVHGTYSNKFLLPEIKVQSAIRLVPRPFDMSLHAAYVSAGLVTYHARTGYHQRAAQLASTLPEAVYGLDDVSSEVEVLDTSGKAILKFLSDFMYITRL